jgi:hypothetical protein
VTYNSSHSYFYNSVDIHIINTRTGASGGAMVETLRYKPEGRGSIPDGVTGNFP